MAVKFSISKSPASAFVGPGGDDAWACYFYVGRCFEPKAPTLRAWQIKLLWFELSAWWSSNSQSVAVLPSGLAIRAIALLAMLSLAACDGQINLFGSPTQVQGQPAASPSPSPSPSPSIAPSPDPCLIKAVRVSFAGGSSAQTPSLPLGGEPVRLDATPINEAGPVPDGCQATRSVVWAVQTPVTCQIVGSGFNPFLRGVRVGVCTVTATVERVVSDPFSVEVR